MTTTFHAPPVVEAFGVSKTFRIPHERRERLKDYVLHPRWRATYEQNRAVLPMDVSIRSGEFFGIIGPNGSGKSTLLKILAGIYKPTTGSVRITGKLTPFIELGVGFHPELSGRDNVRINGTLLGMTKAELDAKFDEIFEFAEVERFVDQKLKDYSTGMHQRLAYAVAVQTPSEILFLDEVLAVGDERFHKKCHNTFLKMQAEKKTVVLVTHDLPWVNAFCNRALLLRKGKAEMCGPPDRVIEHYLQTEAN
jgi:ABC-type polysaccharide/polyol phosphate transport system ATPase subunit